MSILIAILVAALLTLATYWSQRHFDLAVLRFLSILFVMLFLMGVSIRYNRRVKLDARLYRDVSPSMANGGKWDWADSVTSMLSQKLGTPIPFSDSIYSPDVDSAVGTYTDLTLPMRDAGDKACLMLTDGLHNAPIDPYTVANSVSYPVFFIIPPSENAGLDIGINNVVHPSVIVQGENASVTVEYSLSALDSVIAHFTVTEDTNTLLDKRMVVRPGRGRFNFSLKPASIGLHVFRLRFDRLEGESDTVNNTRTIGIEVIKGKSVGVLLASHPDPTIRLLRGVVERAKYADIDVIVRVDNKKWKFMGKTVKDTVPVLSNPDFVILIDPDPAILKAVKGVDPGKIIVFPGRVSVQNRLFSLIQSRGRVAPGPNWNEIGSKFTDWNDLPSVGVFTGRAPIKVFIRSGQKPAVFTDRDGSYIVGIEKFWMLGLYRPEFFNDLIEYFIEKAARPENILFVYPDPPVPFKGQPVRIIAEAYDGFGNPLTSLNISFQGPRGDTIDLAYMGDGKYISPPIRYPAGKHKLTVNFMMDSTSMGVRSTQLQVLDVPIEVLQTGVDTLVPATIARLTGGRVFSSAGEFMDYYRNLYIQKPVDIQFNRFIPFLLIAILLAALEWWLRKNRGLA